MQALVGRNHKLRKDLTAFLPHAPGRQHTNNPATLAYFIAQQRAKSNDQNIHQPATTTPSKAADGSQIAPDRHAAVLYSLVNVGAIVLRPGSGQAPEVFTESALLFDDEMYTESGLLTEEAIQLRRDLAERRALLALARVEFPRWVAEDEALLNALHAALVEQCRLMGARPYPYLLHRAHEIAVVCFEEKRQVEQMLALELRRAGGEVGELSGKQSAKELREKG